MLLHDLAITLRALPDGTMEETCVGLDFTIVGSDVRRHDKLVKEVAEYARLAGWVSTAASGNLIGRAVGRARDVADFKCWLQYVGPGIALTQDTRYTDRITTTTEDLGVFEVM